jgi:hypothetical protein
MQDMLHVSGSSLQKNEQAAPLLLKYSKRQFRFFRLSEQFNRFEPGS